MDFEFSADEATLRDSVRLLLATEYTLERRQAFLTTQHGSSPEIWRLLSHQGVFSLGLPQEAGGYGGCREIMLVMEELGRRLVLEPFLSTVVLGGGLIRDQGTVAQRAHLLPKIAAGELRSALAHHEAGARYVLDHLGTSARRGKGSYVITGSKAIVLDAPVVDMLIVSARDESAGGVSLFMVAPNAPGVRTTQYRTPDGRSAADLALENVRVPTAARLGPPSVALTALEQAVDCAMAARYAEAIGIIEALIELTLQTLNTRKPGGAEIDRFQQMFLLTVQAKAMSYLAADYCRDRERSERRRVLSTAKTAVGNAARFVGQQALQLHSGSGKPVELTVNHYFQRLMMIDATFGDLDHYFGALGERADWPIENC
jgi:alkylation response protein AidB-like acyl-CoA dehydrogenase